MTREEAMVAIKEAYGNTEYTYEIIKALEQEPIFDKIRAEIEQMDFDFGDFYDHTSTIIDMVLEVIDKHKVKSEVPDADSD